MGKNIGKEAENRITELLEKAGNAVDLYDGLYGHDGVFRTVASNRAEREIITGLPVYKQAQQTLSRIRKAEAEQFMADTDATIEKKRQLSRINLVVPKTLHLALKEEAKEEGVSLSELVRLKISAPYEGIVKLVTRKGKSGEPGQKKVEKLPSRV